jgi:predicted TIM-barrel fold metal-dependent hydrolase
MCSKFPDTPVVIDHFARIGVDGKIRDEQVKQLCALAKFKNTYLKVSAFYALGKKQRPYTDLIPMIRRTYDAFGPKRLMWGSDSPYQLDGENTYEASIDLVRKGLKFLTDSDRQSLLRDTANKVFFSQLS